MRIFVFLAAILWSGLANAGAELVMVERDGCVWCARWNAEIAPIYPKTTEGVAAPLRRVQLSGPYPDDLQFETKLVFTPTFVLMVDGKEQGRLEGYAGDQFFWYLLGELMKNAGVVIEPAS